MNNFLDTIQSVFYNVLKFENFKIVEKKENSVLFYNNKCYLFIGHHMGEVYVNLSSDKKNTIQPLMWAIINKKIKYSDTLSLKFSPNTKMRDLLIYMLCVEKTLISLYCKDLINGDFSKQEHYVQNFEEKSKEFYRFNEENNYLNDTI